MIELKRWRKPMLIKNVLMDENEGLYIDFSDLIKRIEALEKDPYVPGEKTNYLSILHNPICIGTYKTFRAWRPSYFTKTSTTITQETTNREYYGPIKVNETNYHTDLLERTTGRYISTATADSGWYESAYTRTEENIAGPNGYFHGLTYDADNDHLSATSIADGPEYGSVDSTKTSSQEVVKVTRTKLDSPTIYTLELPDSVSTDFSEYMNHTTEYTIATIGSNVTVTNTKYKGLLEDATSYINYEDHLQVFVQDEFYIKNPYLKKISTNNIINDNVYYINKLELYFTKVETNILNYANPDYSNGTIRYYSESYSKNPELYPDDWQDSKAGECYLTLDIINYDGPDAATTLSYVLNHYYEIQPTLNTSLGWGQVLDLENSPGIHKQLDISLIQDTEASVNNRYAEGDLEVNFDGEQPFLTMQNNVFSREKFPRIGVYVRKGTDMYLVCDFDYDSETIDGVRYVYYHFCPAEEIKTPIKANVTDQLKWSGTAPTGSLSKEFVRVPLLDIYARFAGIYINDDSLVSGTSIYDGYKSWIYYSKNYYPDSFKSALNSQGSITSYTE